MISKDFVQKKHICAFSSLFNTIAKGDKWLCIFTVHLEWVTESRALFPVLHCHGNNLASHSGMAVYPVSGSFQFSSHYCESPCLSPWLTLIMKPRDRNLPLSHYSNKTIVLISLLCVCVCVCVLLDVYRPWQLSHTGHEFFFYFAAFSFHVGENVFSVCTDKYL